MPNIRPVSELRNYGEVLTKNGRGRYAVLDMEEYRTYEKLLAMQRLSAELEKGRKAGQEQGYLDADEVFDALEARYDG